MKVITGLAIGLATLFVGCASAPPMHEVLTPLRESVAVTSSGPRSVPRFYHITAAVVNVQVAKNPPAAGELWVYVKALDGSSSDTSFVLLTEVANFSMNRGAGSTYRVQLKGKPAWTLDRVQFYLCDIGQTPTDSRCPVVKSFHGRTLYWDSTQPASKVTEGPLGSDLVDINEGIVRVWAPAEVKRGLAQIDAEFEAKQQREANAVINAQLQSQAAERGRKARVSGSPRGLIVNCTSQGLLARNEPVAAGLAFNCAGLGESNMAELRAAGWEARVTGRIATNSPTGIADSIEMEAVKRK